MTPRMYQRARGGRSRSKTLQVYGFLNAIAVARRVGPRRSHETIGPPDRSARRCSIARRARWTLWYRRSVPSNGPSYSTVKSPA